MTTRSRSPSTRWRSAASATSRSSTRRAGRPASCPRATCSGTRHRARVSAAPRGRARRGPRRRPDLGDPAARTACRGAGADRVRYAGRRAPSRRRSRRSTGVPRRPDRPRLRRDRGHRAAAPRPAPGPRRRAARRCRAPAGGDSPPARSASTPIARLFEGDRALGAWLATLMADPPIRRLRCPDPRPPPSASHERLEPQISEIQEIPAEIPAERIAIRLAGARREAAVAGLDALLIGVGADLRYLPGYDAVALERLTMLVVPVAEGAQLTLVAPRLEATPARACAAGGAGRRDRSSPGRRPSDPMRSRRGPRWCSRRARRRTVAAGGSRSRTSCRAAPPAPAPGRLRPGARFELASADAPRAADRQGRRRDRAADRGGARGRPGRRRDRGAGRLVGRTEADVAREVRERLIAEGHDARRVRDRRVRARTRASPHHERRRARDPGRRADRARHRRHHRRLRSRHHPDAVGDRRRPGARPRRGVPAPVRRAPGAQAAATRRRRARASRPRRIDAARARSSTPKATATAFFHRTGPRHRARGPRGAVPRRRQRRAAPRRGSPSAWSPASTSRAGTARGSRTSSCADLTGRSCSTRRSRELRVVNG